MNLKLSNPLAVDNVIACQANTIRCTVISFKLIFGQHGILFDRSHCTGVKVFNYEQLKHYWVS